MRSKHLAAMAVIAVGSIFSKPAPAQGRSVALPDGRKMQINCTGAGSPTILLEGGLGWFESTAWQQVQPKVARFTRVCSYDPAGTGESDPGPIPRDGSRITADLHALLQAAGEKPPYILVGHSFGGLLIRIYAAHYPSEIAGLVFVDPTVPSQFALPGGKATFKDSKAFFEGCLRVATAGEMVPDTKAFRECVTYPNTQHGVVALAQRPATWQTVLSEYESFDADTSGIALTEHLPYTFPIVVLTASQRRAGLTKALSEESQRAWLTEHQRLLASLSTNGEQRLVSHTSHYIQRDRPDVVVDAIRTVLEKHVRSNTVSSVDPWLRKEVTLTLFVLLCVAAAVLAARRARAA